MDSQENTLNQGTLESEKNVEQSAVQVETADESATAAPVATDPQANEQPVEEAAPAKVYKTKKEVIERLKEIVASDECPAKEEIDHLKTVFYKLHIAEREAALKAYIDGGGDPETYQIVPDEDEEVFKAEMSVVREKRAKVFQQQEKEKQENLQKKLDIIEKIKAMATSPEEANKSYNEFKELQQQWKEIKAVPAERASELWRNYQLYVEQFYDLLKLNSEAREYDFKKNLEIKTKLCEAAENLANEEDVISAFHQLQELHQQYFETLRAGEEENLNKKTELCEKVEALIKEENKGAADWEKHTKEIIALQAEWKNIGFAPQKMNVKIFERFRAACDDFFGRKVEYFKKMKAELAENAEKKRALVEKAKALQDSTDWKSTSDKLVALQKEWKTIGMVQKRLGDQLWKEFLDACNKFFEARNAANAGTHNEERENLAKKKDVIEKLKAVLEAAADDAQQQVQKLVEEYNAIGHVPYKEKDKVYDEYHEVLDKIYKQLNVSATRRRLNNFKNNLKNVAKRGEDALDNERGRLVRRFEQLKQEVQTYENNLGFLNASSKKGNSLVEEMNRKVQKLRDDMELVKQKIKAIDAENK